MLLKMQETIHMTSYNQIQINYTEKQDGGKYQCFLHYKTGIDSVGFNLYVFDDTGSKAASHVTTSTLSVITYSQTQWSTDGRKQTSGFLEMTTSTDNVTYQSTFHEIVLPLIII